VSEQPLIANFTKARFIVSMKIAGQRSLRSNASRPATSSGMGARLEAARRGDHPRRLRRVRRVVRIESIECMAIGFRARERRRRSAFTSMGLISAPRRPSPPVTKPEALQETTAPACRAPEGNPARRRMPE